MTSGPGGVFLLCNGDGIISAYWRKKPQPDTAEQFSHLSPLAKVMAYLPL